MRYVFKSILFITIMYCREIYCALLADLTHTQMEEQNTAEGTDANPILVYYGTLKLSFVIFIFLGLFIVQEKEF